MVFVIKDPILSYFNSISTTFKGFGINLYLLHDHVTSDLKTKLADIPFSYARVLLSVPDPTRGALTLESLDHMDNLFTTAPYATDSSTDADSGVYTPSSAEKFVSDFNALHLQGLFCFLPPKSWLDADGFLIDESALIGYANMIISGVLWLRKLGLNADVVELFPEPDSGAYGFVNPKDCVIIANRLRDTCITRGVFNPPIKICGPGLGSVLPLVKDIDLYTESFVFGKTSMDCWSIHANENVQDAEIYNSGSFAARIMLKDRLRKSVSQMNAVNFLMEKLVTSFSTRANAFSKCAYSTGDSIENGNGTITPNVLSDSNEFCLRLIENFIAIASNGFTTAFYHSLSPRLDADGNVVDPEEATRSIYGLDGDLRLVGKLWKYLMDTLPIPGNVYISEEINEEEDFTVKTLLTTTNGDKFCFVLCRPVQPDNLLGRLRLTINNPLWSTNYEVKDITVSSFPDAAKVTVETTTNDLGQTVTKKTVGEGVDLSNVVVKATMNLNYMTLFVKDLPYGGCCICISGTVSLKEPITPVPAPLPAPAPSPAPAPVGGTGTVPSDSSPVVMQTIMQMPVNYGEPKYKTYPVGTIFYDSKAKIVKTFVNGVWVETSFLSYA